MITLKNVSKRFKDKEVFSDVSFSIDKNGVYLIRGSSGSGKTTLLNIIGNFISFKGLVRNDYLDNMSYVFQNSYLIEHLTIKENLDLYKIDCKILKRYKLYYVVNHYPCSLSRGERSRIAFIIGIYRDSRLVLIDEPITNLDKVNAEFIIDEIFKFRKDKIIVIVSHENKRFIKKVNGIITIKNKKVIYREIRNGSEILEGVKNDIKIDKHYLYKENKFYRKEYLKRYLVIFLSVLILFSFSLMKSVFIKSIEKDIKHSVDYNKFYLSECRENDYDGIILKSCHNPSSEALKSLKDKNIKYGFNYDYLLNSVYSRDDLWVVSNADIDLYSGRYPLKYNEVIASDKYNINDTINLKAKLIVNDIYNDVYNKDVELVVVGIYYDLTFFDDNYIFFDYDLTDEYFKNEMLINNEYSLYEYYNNIEVENYRYLAFSDYKDETVEFTGNKYEFYSNLKLLYIECERLFKGIELFVLVYTLYIMYKLNLNKLKSTQKSRASLLANSYRLEMNIITSVLTDVITISLIFGVFVLMNIIFGLNCILHILLYALALLELVFQTIFMYRKKAVSKLMRCESW